MLRPESPPAVNIAGDYTLTLEADPVCAASLPPEIRTRRYPVMVAPSESPYNDVDTYYDIRFNATAISDEYEMHIGVAGSFLGFGLYGGHNPFLLELIGTGEQLAFSGWSPGVSVAMSGVSTIAASFDGAIEYRGRIGPSAACEARNHRMVLARR